MRLFFKLICAAMLLAFKLFGSALGQDQNGTRWPITQIVTKLTNNDPNMTMLFFWGSDFDDSEIRDLTESLKNNKSLQVLRFVSTALKEDEVA